MKLGLIDLGSNSARMYLLSLVNGKWQILVRRRVMCRLSEGMGEERRLQPEAMARTVEVLQAFAKEMQKEDAHPFAVATAAVRKAVNREEFLQKVKTEVGFPLSVISGELEAFFDFQGVLAALPTMENCLICDTGGGSTELILCKNRTLTAKVSLPFGAMTLQERFEQAVLEGEAALDAEFDKIPFLQEAEGFPLVGIGGSVCALYGIDTSKNKGELNGYTLSPHEVEAMFSKLYPCSAEERMAMGVEKGRADTICAGLLPSLCLLRRIHAPSLTLSTGGLREGIMAELEKENPLFYVQNPEEFFEKYLDYTGIL